MSSCCKHSAATCRPESAAYTAVSPLRRAGMAISGYRSRAAGKGACAHQHHHHEHAPMAKPDAQAVAGFSCLRLSVPAMDCPTEAAMIDKALRPLPGVRDLAFDYIERAVGIYHEKLDEAVVLAALQAIGMPGTRLQSMTGTIKTPSHKTGWQLPVAGMLAATAEGLAFAGAGDRDAWVVLAALLSMALSGPATLRKGWFALKTGTLNIFFLMSIAVLGAMLLQQWPEAAMVLFLFALSEKLEARALARAGDAVRSLMALRPETAWLAQADGWQEVAVSAVQIGQIVRVRPGERVPLDGEITLGHSQFNEAPITGESLPLEKGIGDKVFAGAINGGALVQVRVIEAADGSVLARIIRSVREAQAGKAPTQRFIDRFAARYTPLVVVMALLVALVLPLAGVMGWQAAMYKALVLLVIACPCALVIATPVTLVSALASAARHGMLIKGGAALESAAKVRTIALDKTGTLTRGDVTLTRITRLTDSDDEAQLLVLAAALEQHSTHPLAQAICRNAREAGLTVPADAVVHELPGRGVQGQVGGQAVALGNRRFARELGVAETRLAALLDPLEAQGEGYVLLLLESALVAVLHVDDPLRPQAKSALQALKAMGLHVLVLSGDQQAVVTRVTAALPLDDARGGLLPDDKREILAQAQRHGAVAMVGDGVNDAPALAQADLGIAMGAAGSDTALDTAQVALMEDRLDKLPQLFAHARRSMAVLKANIVIALAIKLLFFVLALAGMATLWMAVFADVGASLLVIGNGLRLARSGMISGKEGETP